MRTSTLLLSPRDTPPDRETNADAMPRYYCDYCDTYLTHDSPSVRKQHNAGYKHKANVRTYYQQFEEQQTQSLIDQKIKEHLGQAAVQYQVGAAFNQFLQTNPHRPRPPILPLPMGTPPQMPIGSPFVPGFRPPVLPPPGTTGYGAAPTVPPSMAPPIAPSMPMQVNNLPGPPMVNPPVPGATTAPTPNSAMNTVTYQANPSFTSGSSTAPAGSTNSQKTFAYSQNS